MSTEKKIGTDINTAPTTKSQADLAQQIMPSGPPQKSLGRKWEKGKLVPDHAEGLGTEKGGLTYEQLKAKQQKAQDESSKVLTDIPQHSDLLKDPKADGNTLKLPSQEDTGAKKPESKK